VEQRDIDGVGDRVGHQVHGVGAQQDEVGAAALQAEGGVFHPVGQFIPIALMLEALDLAEIDRPHQAARRVNAAEPVANLAVDDPVVFGGAFPAHAADEADHGLLAHLRPYPAGLV